MNTLTQNNSVFKRVKERNVCEAIEKVEEWRRMFDEGCLDQDGLYHKITLNKAAELVGIPKKTLEDYTQIFKKVNLIANINLFSDRKMGYLRSYLRKNQSKLRKAIKQQKLKEIELAQLWNEKRQNEQKGQNENLNVDTEMSTQENSIFFNSQFDYTFQEDDIFQFEESCMSQFNIFGIQNRQYQSEEFA